MAIVSGLRPCIFPPGAGSQRHGAFRMHTSFAKVFRCPVVPPIPLAAFFFTQFTYSFSLSSFYRCCSSGKLNLRLPQPYAVPASERPSMDLGPRAGDIVASCEDLIFAAASVMVFVGPQPPPMPVVEEPPSPLPEMGPANEIGDGDGNGVAVTAAGASPTGPRQDMEEFDYSNGEQHGYHAGTDGGSGGGGRASPVPVGGLLHRGTSGLSTRDGSTGTVVSAPAGGFKSGGGDRVSTAGLLHRARSSGPAEVSWWSPVPPGANSKGAGGPSVLGEVRCHRVSIVAA